MVGGRVHYELFVRKYPQSEWVLELATEVRLTALDTAKEMVERGTAAAVQVTRETLDDDTGEFNRLTILTLGVAKQASKPKIPESTEPLCVTPQDLYTCHARDRIGRLFEDWLERRVATPFELLHRPDLVEKLEASGVEIKAAIQKVATPESYARGVSIAEMIQSFTGLSQRAIERLLKDGRRAPKIDVETFAKVAAQMTREGEGGFLLGCSVADALAPALSWGEKITLLLDLADAAPPTGSARTLALSVLAEPLGEILGSKNGLDNILGGGLDLGGSLAAMSRLAAAEVVDALVRVERSVAKIMPALSPKAQRLAKWLASGEFTDARAAIGQRVVRELGGPRRLRPGNPVEEIDVIRGLAMALTAAAGKLLPIDTVQVAFSARSKMLVTREFVEAYLGEDRAAHEEAQALVWLTENIIGAGNKREAGRWLQSLIMSLRFENEYRISTASHLARLGELTRLQRSVARCGLVEEDYRPIQARLGDIGGMVEADGKVILQTLRSPSPVLARLTVLLKLAAGEIAPLGPAADRARIEALKFARQDATRVELAGAPEQVDAIRDLIQHAAKAA